MKSIKEEYLDFFIKNTSIDIVKIKSRKDGSKVKATRITIPLLNNINDFIEIYVIKDDIGYILSDGGETSVEIEMAGLSVPFEDVNFVLEKYGAKLDIETKNISMSCKNVKNLGNAINMFSQSLLAVYNISAMDQYKKFKDI